MKTRITRPANLLIAICFGTYLYTPSIWTMTQSELDNLSIEEQIELATRLNNAELDKQQKTILSPDSTYVRYVEVPELGNAYQSFTENASYRTPLYKVHQLAIRNPQINENITCGPRALFFAHTIEALHKENTPIGAKAIATKLEKNPHFAASIEACHAQLESNQFEAFISNNALSLAHLYVLCRNINPNGIYYVRPYLPMMEPSEFTTHLSNVGKQLSQRKINSPLHFILNDSNKKHWVLISIIQGALANTPIVYYIDSKNVDLAHYQAAHPIIAYIVDSLGIKSIEDTRQ